MTKLSGVNLTMSASSFWKSILSMPVLLVYPEEAGDTYIPHRYKSFLNLKKILAKLDPYHISLRIINNSDSCFNVLFNKNCYTSS